LGSLQRGDEGLVSFGVNELVWGVCNVAMRVWCRLVSIS
jgi:hypothetical protein